MTGEMNKTETCNKGRKTIPKRRYEIVMNLKVIIKPQKTESLKTKVDFRKYLEGHTGLIIRDENLESNTESKLFDSTFSCIR